MKRTAPSLYRGGMLVSLEVRLALHVIPEQF
jgi:hypothetical protein